MLNKFVLSTNNTQENNKSEEIINKLNKVVALHKTKEKNYNELINLKGKILLDQQVEEDLKRSVSEVENSYLEQIQELEEGAIKKDGVLLQNEKKFNEVEVYIKRECLAEKKYHKYKKYEILPFLRQHQEYCLNALNLNKIISTYKNNLVTIENENKLISDEIEICNLNTTKQNDEREGNSQINKDYLESFSKKLKGTNEILTNRTNEKIDDSSKKKNKKSFSLINFSFFKSKPKETGKEIKNSNLAQEKINNVPIVLPNNNEKVQFNLSSNAINTQISNSKLQLKKDLNQNDAQILNSTYKDKLDDNGKDNSVFNLFKKAFRSNKDTNNKNSNNEFIGNLKVNRKEINYKKKSKHDKLNDVLITKIKYLNSIISQKKDFCEKQNLKTDLLSVCNEKIKEFIKLYDDYLKTSKLITNKLDNGELNMNLNLNVNLNSDKNSLSMTDDQQIKNNDDLNLISSNTTKDFSVIIENKLLDLIIFLEDSKTKIRLIDEKINAIKMNNQLSFKEVDCQYESENINNIVSQFGFKKLQLYDYEKEYKTHKDNFSDEFTSNLFENDINTNKNLNMNTLQNEILNNTINLEDSYMTDGTTIRNTYQTNNNEENWEISMIRK